MEQSINVNFQNLTEEERETLLELCKKSQKKEVKKGLWIPNEYEIYYYITSNGEINYKSFDINSPYDQWDLINNNCFKTKEEAEFELEKRRVIYELRKFAAVNNTEEIDWDDTRQEKYYIYYDYELKSIYIDLAWSSKLFNNICFISPKICEQAINEIGEDRIKKYLFDIEE